MNYKDTIKKQSVIISISVIVMSVILIGTSFALFTDRGESATTQVITGGTFNVDYSSSSVTTQTGNIAPTSVTGLMPAMLHIENSGNIDAQYQILVYTVDDNEVPHEYINALAIDEDEITAAGENFESLLIDKALSTYEKTKETQNSTDLNTIQYVVKTGNVNKGSSFNVYVLVWVDEDAPSSIVGKNISVDMKVVSIPADSE